MYLPTYKKSVQIYCVSTNCYAVADEVAGAEVWPLFDRETLENLLMTMTAHEDWIASLAPKTSREVVSLSLNPGENP